MSYIVYRKEEERRSEKRKTITQNLKLGQKSQKPYSYCVLCIAYRARKEEDKKLLAGRRGVLRTPSMTYIKLCRTGVPRFHKGRPACL